MEIELMIQRATQSKREAHNMSIDDGSKQQTQGKNPRHGTRVHGLVVDGRLVAESDLLADHVDRLRLVVQIPVVGRRLNHVHMHLEQNGGVQIMRPTQKKKISNKKSKLSTPLHAWLTPKLSATALSVNSSPQVPDSLIDRR